MLRAAGTHLLRGLATGAAGAASGTGLSAPTATAAQAAAAWWLSAGRYISGRISSSTPTASTLDTLVVRRLSTVEGTQDSTSEPKDEDAGPSGTHDEHSGDDLRTRILNAALTHVPEYGWSDDAVRKACADQQLSPSAAGMLEAGKTELVFHFIRQSNASLTAALEERAEELAHMPVRDRIKTAVRMRLEMNVPYIDSWPQALALAAHSDQVATSLTLMGELVDDIWHAAGDVSTDHNWYTKRMLLAGVYTATELFMLTDYSPNYAETWAALDRRVDDLVSVGKHFGQLASQVGAFVSGLTPPGSK